MADWRATSDRNLRFGILGSLDGALEVDFCHGQFTRALSDDASIWANEQFHQKSNRGASDEGRKEQRGRAGSAGNVRN